MRVVRSKKFKVVRQLSQQPTALPAASTSKPGLKVISGFQEMDICAPDAKKFTEIKEGDRVVDYKDVTIKGYLSTFVGTTPSDRDGDYVQPGAFTETIPKFKKNPVLLVGHQNSVRTLAGSFTVIREDNTGLYVEAVLSNSPVDEMRDLRAKVAEGHLKTLSMGGRFHYLEDGRGIFKVDLYEGSLTPIPANPDATFSTRSLTDEEIKMVQNLASYLSAKPAGVTTGEMARP